MGGCIRKKGNEIKLSSRTTKLYSKTEAASGVFTTGEGKKTLDERRSQFNRFVSGINPVETELGDIEVIKVEKKPSITPNEEFIDIKGGDELASLNSEEQKMNTIEVSLIPTKSLRKKITNESEVQMTEQELKGNMQVTLRGIFGNMNFIYNRENNFTFNEKEKTFNSHKSSSHMKRNFTMKTEKSKFSKESEEIAFGNKRSDVSVDSIFTSRSLLSEAENFKNLLDGNDSDENENCTTMTPFYSIDSSPYQTIVSNRGSNRNINFHTINNKSQGQKHLTINYNSNFKTEENHKSIDSYNSIKSTNSSTPGKTTSFLQIKFNPFERHDSTYRKIFFINLLKCFYETALFMKLSKKWSKQDSFASSQVNEHYYKKFHDYLNNHSIEFDTIFQKNKEEKDFMTPLYQILSNNLNIKRSRLISLKHTKIENTNLENTMPLINDKYLIMQEISRDEKYNVWTMHRCKNLVKNKMCSIKILNKKTQSVANLRNFLQHDLQLENRMVCLKYNLKIKEIISSNAHDYLITEYVDCSLYDLIMNTKKFEEGESIFSQNEGLQIEIVWKLMRNLISALDYCHNVAKIAHRNLNLKNIFFIKEEFLLKISDYSLSSILDEDNLEHMPCERNIHGAFPPPEYYEDFYSGESGDIWACGIIFYFILFKSLPVVINSIPKEFEIPYYDEDNEVNELLKAMLKENVEERIDLKTLKMNSWLIRKNEFPLPNVCDDTIDLVLKEMRKKVKDKPV